MSAAFWGPHFQARNEVAIVRSKAATGLTVCRYPLLDLTSQVAETLDLFHPALPHPSELLNVRPSYKTNWGAMYEGDATDFLASIPGESRVAVSRWICLERAFGGRARADTDARTADGDGAAHRGQQPLCAWKMAAHQI